MAEDAVANMRAQIDALEARVKETEAERETFRTERDGLSTKVKSYQATQLGLTLAQAELFIQGLGDGEITKDAVVEFANRLNFPLREEGAAEQPVNTQESMPGGSSSLMSMSGASAGSGEGGAASAGSTTMTKDEWKELHRRDPSAARVAFRQGRVELRPDNFWVQNAAASSGK